MACVGYDAHLPNGDEIAHGAWCNGNTTGSDPVIPGSNPGAPTKLPHKGKRRLPVRGTAVRCD